MSTEIKERALPAPEELYRRYAHFAEIYFDNKVPPPREVVIEWSGRLTSSAGNCSYVKKRIRLSTHYHRKYPEEVDSTLLHEMIHLLVPNHGPAFYRWMELIRARGGAVRRHAKDRAKAKRYRWLYTCKDCGMQRKNARRYPGGGRYYRCGRCGGRLTEERI